MVRGRLVDPKALKPGQLVMIDEETPATFYKKHTWRHGEFKLVTPLAGELPGDVYVFDYRRVYEVDDV